MVQLEVLLTLKKVEIDLANRIVRSIQEGLGVNDRKTGESLALDQASCISETSPETASTMGALAFETELSDSRNDTDDIWSRRICKSDVREEA